MAGSDGSAAFTEGAPCWVDAQLPDVEAGRRFYGELFGWTFAPTAPNEPTYANGPAGPGGSAAPGGPVGPGGPVVPGGPAGLGGSAGSGGSVGPDGSAGSGGSADPDGATGPDGSVRPDEPTSPEGSVVPGGSNGPGRSTAPDEYASPDGSTVPDAPAAPSGPADPDGSGPQDGGRPPGRAGESGGGGPQDGSRPLGDARESGRGGPQDGGGPPDGARESGGGAPRDGAGPPGGAREPDGAREPGRAQEARAGGPWGAGPWTGAVPAYLGDAPVAALVPKQDGRMPTVWTVYFATPDVRDMSDRIRKGGGQIVTAPVPVGPYGVAALAADPEGAVFGLWQAGTHTGFGGRREPGAPAPGTFAWVELYARDTAVADAFYPGLFRDALFGPGVTREFGRAPLTDVFPPEMPPHFLVHFAVRDCEAALAAVTRLGGRVHAPPFDASYGRVAVVSDNQGASFALLQRRDAP